MLGECVLELGALISQLTDVFGVGVRQSLSFFRSSRGKDEVVVGKFNIVLKIVGDYLSKSEAMFDGQNLTGPRKAKSQVHPLPLEDPNFKWRVRCDLRQAINVPQAQPNVLPCIFVELGWSLYEENQPEDFNKILSNLIEKNAFPDFN